jgi:hypothetical protein
VVHDLDNALLLNGWLGRPVQLLVLIRNGAPPGELPPSQPSPGWHVLLGRKARLGRPKLGEATDLERQLTVGTYELGDGPLKLLFGDLPYQRVLALGKDDQPDRLAFYLPGSTVVPVAWRGIEPEGSPAFLAGGRGRPSRAARSWFHSQRLWFGPSPLDDGQPVPSLEPGDGIE